MFTIRIARPCRSLERAEAFYVDGLGLSVLYRAEAEAEGEHDLLMVGHPDAAWHLELVRAEVEPAPTDQDLLVLYYGAAIDDKLVARLEANGGEVVGQGPYWDRWGITIADPDGYRLVLSTRTWSNS